MDSKPESGASANQGGRIGSYRVVRHLVSAPGAQMLEGADEDGAQVLLQVTRCRRARGATEENECLEMLRTISSQTSEIRANGFKILEHGQSANGDEIVLYWVLPWTERANSFGMARINTAKELVDAGIALAGRLVRMHQKGHHNPLLSERLLLLDSDPQVLSVPIRVPDRWLTESMRPGRLAPEEALSKETTEAGDVWRLGQTLKALTVGINALPDDLSSALDWLGHPEVNERIATAENALELLESLGDWAPAREPSDLERTLIKDSERLPVVQQDLATIANEPVPRKIHHPPEDSSTEPTVIKKPSATGGDETLIDFRVPKEMEGAKVKVLDPPRAREVSQEEAIEPANRGEDKVGLLDAPTIANEPLPKGDIPKATTIPVMRKKRTVWDTGPEPVSTGPTGTLHGPSPNPNALVRRPQVTSTPDSAPVMTGAARNLGQHHPLSASCDSGSASGFGSASRTPASRPVPRAAKCCGD